MDDTQTLILQRTAGLMQYVEEHYGENAIVRMSLVAIEVSTVDEDGKPEEGTHTLLAWGDDRGYVQTGFLDEIYEELDMQKALANSDRNRAHLEDEDDE